MAFLNVRLIMFYMSISKIVADDWHQKLTQRDCFG